MRTVKSLLSLAVLGAAFTSSPAVAQRALFPDTLSLPDGFQPEGVTVHGLKVLAGSMLDGDIYQVSAVTGQGELLVDAPAGRTAIGIEVDRHDHLFVAGGPLGAAYVYDANTGEPLAEYVLDATGTGLINDVVVTRDAAYFTDSSLPVIYRIPLGRGGALPEPETVEVIALEGPAADDLLVGEFNLNGIEYAPWADALIVVNSAVGRLYAVNPATGESAVIDLADDDVVNGDGIVLRGLRLYVVQNFDNAISVVRLHPRLERGQLLEVIEDERFQIPTTADAIGPYLFAVNARFDVAPPPLPGTPPADPSLTFDIVRVPALPGIPR